MAQTGWRLPDDLLKRVRVHCAQTGERQNEFVRQALEKALGGQGSGDTSSVASPRRSGSVKETAPTEPPAPSRTPAPGADGYTPLASAQPLGKGFVPPRPKGT